VTLYEMQGYDHGAMPFPAYKILKDHIRRITAKMTPALTAQHYMTTAVPLVATMSIEPLAPTVS
jgi:hypothetical protein